MFVCVCVCRLLQLLKAIGLLTWNAIVAFLEQCIANIVHGVFLIYSVELCTRMLAARVRKELQSCKAALSCFVHQPLILWTKFELLVSSLATIIVDHLSFPTSYFLQ